MEIIISIIRTHNFSAKLIHIGMWLWCIFRGLKPQKTFNHCEFRYMGFTSGAISEGVKTRNWLSYWTGLKKKSKIDYSLTLSNAEWDFVEKYLNNAENTKYEFENFWWHLVKIITGKWEGDKTTKKTYCYEHVIRALNAIGRFDIDVFMNPYEFKIWADSNLV